MSPVAGGQLHLPKSAAVEQGHADERTRPVVR